MNVTPDLLPNMAQLKGPAMQGFVVTAILFGCSALLFVHYLQFSMSTDTTRTRFLAFGTAIMACISMSFVLATTLRQYAFRFGLGPEPDDAIWESWNYIADAVTRLMISGFFARRAWKLNGRTRWLAVVLILALLTTAGSALGAMINSIRARFGAGTRDELGEVLTYVWVISEMVGDAGITLLIVIKLLRSKTGWKQTDTTIQKLVFLCIETQAPPTIMAIGFLVTYITAPTPAYISFFVCMPMVYVYCLFATLNSRYTISAHRDNESSTWRTEVRSKKTIPTAINVTTETYTHAEAPDKSFMKMPVNPRQQNTTSDSTESLPDDNKDMNTSEIRLV